MKNRVPFKRLVLDKMKTILDIGSGVYIMASQEIPPPLKFFPVFVDFCGQFSFIKVF